MSEPETRDPLPSDHLLAAADYLRQPVMLPSEQLLAAADAIRTFGWCQGSRVNCNGEVCALGACDELAPEGGDGIGWEARRILWRLLEPVAVAVGAHSVAQWNDAPERTADEVIEALHAAAALAESEGR